MDDPRNIKLKAALIPIGFGTSIAVYAGYSHDWAVCFIGVLFSGLGLIFLHFEDIKSFKFSRDGLEAHKVDKKRKNYGTT
jgi:hypothetical protein